LSLYRHPFYCMRKSTFLNLSSVLKVLAWNSNILFIGHIFTGLPCLEMDWTMYI
jgi:hypothetical protein